MIAEVTIREALRTEPLRTEAEMLEIIKAAKFQGSNTTPAGSLFEACVEAVAQAADDLLTFEGDRAVVRAVIQTIIDRTPSPRTVDELTRILAGGV